MKTINKLCYFGVIAISALFTVCAYADSEGCIKGVVTYVDDGDTAKVEKEDGGIINVRFYGVDSPEKEWPEKWAAQPFSAEAKTFMERLILNKSVCVRLTGDKTYNRVVGEIFQDERSASKAIVGAGLAWWNTKYASSDKVLKQLQLQASRAKMGLWSQDNPEAPWEYRRRHRK